MSVSCGCVLIERKISIANRNDAVNSSKTFLIFCVPNKHFGPEMSVILII